MDPRIDRARVDMVLRQRPALWIGNLGIITLCGAVLWGFFPHWSIVAWCGCNYTLCALRVNEWRRYEQRSGDDPEAVRGWLRRLPVYSFVGGLIWGQAV